MATRTIVIDSSVLLDNYYGYSSFDTIYTTSKIVEEIKDVRNKTKLSIVPVEWKINDPSLESLTKVRLFVEDIGENQTLSEADISVIALCVELSENQGAILRWDTSKTSINENQTKNKEYIGFFSNPNDNDWISPDKSVETSKIAIFCATSDFSMQNVLLQLGIGVVSLEGRIVSQLRRYFRMCSCCKTECTEKDRIFCSICGYKTIIKAYYEVNEHGNSQINYNIPRKSRKEDNSWKSNLFSIRRHGGIIVNQDQLRNQRKKNSVKHNNSKQEKDLIFSDQPFSTHDTASKSFVYGYHLKKNKNVY